MLFRHRVMNVMPVGNASPSVLFTADGWRKFRTASSRPVRHLGVGCPLGLRWSSLPNSGSAWKEQLR